MKSFEALFTLVAVVAFALLVLRVQEPALDDTLYRYQLANDVWRVWWLRGGMDHGWNLIDRTVLNEDADRIGRLTGWCVYVEEEDVANCRDGIVIMAVQKKALVSELGRTEVKNLTLVIAKNA